jgi:YD repeat-containing protein
MKIAILPVTLFLVISASAQYYYNDIISTMETNRQMQTFLTNRVRMVSATGFDQNGVRSTEFSEVQEIRENGKALRYSSRNGTSYSAYYSRFDGQNRLSSITDSSTSVRSVTTYSYDAAGRIARIENKVSDSANDFSQVEVHSWIYNAEGQPQKMWRVINGSDSLEIRFSPDENGNTGDEKTFRRGIETATVYYYYDEKKRLTDIVRYNTKAKKLLPDVMFEYDDNDRVIQKITTTSSLHLGYVIWRYIYNAQGLKTKEALFNDKKELTGKIEYSYIFQ